MRKSIFILLLILTTGFYVSAANVSQGHIKSGNYEKIAKLAKVNREGDTLIMPTLKINVELDDVGTTRASKKVKVDCVGTSKSFNIHELVCANKERTLRLVFDFTDNVPADWLFTKYDDISIYSRGDSDPATVDTLLESAGIPTQQRDYSSFHTGRYSNITLETFEISGISTQVEVIHHYLIKEDGLELSEAAEYFARNIRYGLPYHLHFKGSPLSTFADNDLSLSYPFDVNFVSSAKAKEAVGSALDRKEINALGELARDGDQAAANSLIVMGNVSTVWDHYKQVVRGTNRFDSAFGVFIGVQDVSKQFELHINIPAVFIKAWNIAIEKAIAEN